MDVPLHMGKEEESIFNLFSEYVWNSYTHGMNFEGDTIDDIHAFAPGLDCAINCNLALINVDRESFEYDDQVGGHRGMSPSSGSMTPYHNGLTVAMQDIPPGGELFKFYGDSWFETRESVFGLIPLEDDYQKAERLVRKLASMQDNMNLSEKMKRNLYSFIQNFSWESRTLNALPPSYSQVDHVVKKSMRSLHEVNATRSFEELQATGRCLDNMVHKESTLPFAGRGAFATRNLSKSSIVTGAPLIHVPYDTLAHMYDSKVVGEMIVRDTSKFIGYHLWYNYCLGHKGSTLLLCPYGSGIGYINHNQTLANIKMQWAPQGIVAHNDSWLHLHPADMYNVYKPSLGIDYVATRDIKEGEELFLDYGDDWEEAWQQHVANWDPTEQDIEYISATQWNLENAQEPIRTLEEQKDDPYPENLMVRCHLFLWHTGNRRLYEKRLQSDRNLWPSYEKGRTCNVLDRVQDIDDTITYTVEVFDEEDGASQTRSGVPREMITMVDAPYTTDWHMRSAFRHYIGLPDDMFPDAWLNGYTRSFMMPSE
jgi:hypothetical protein